MQSEFNTKGLVWASVSVLAGAALLYYLTRDDTGADFDPKIHNVEVIHEILDEILLERTCAVIRTYNEIQLWIE